MATRLDTSKLGPIRVPLPGDMTPRQRARETLASRIEDQGPSYRNLADSVRSGFSNIWIAPALLAIEDLLKRLPADE